MKNTPKSKHEFISFYDMFKTFDQYENYLDREEESTLDYLDGLTPLNNCSIRFLASLATKNIRKN